MTLQIAETTKKRRAIAPKIIIDADEISHIEALAEGAMLRNPALADRLMEEISRARIVEHSRMPANVVTIGSTVTYRDETTGHEKSVTLVYPENADISQQRISIVTPVGVAILGLSKGAEFFWDTRADQRRTLTVIEVAQPAANAVAMA